MYLGDTALHRTARLGSARHGDFTSEAVPADTHRPDQLIERHVGERVRGVTLLGDNPTTIRFADEVASVGTPKTA